MFCSAINTDFQSFISSQHLAIVLGTEIPHLHPSSDSKSGLHFTTNSVRNEDEFSSLLLLSSANHTPLLTFWTASWCPSCRVVAPLVREMVERDGVGEKEGGVAFAEVELDSVTIGDLGMRYMITSIPTLLSFSRQEAQLATKVTSVEDMKNPKFLKEWIENEAKRGGTGGAGGGLFGIFGR
ncbi:MAG: hypothetical protein M1819_002957 [Sarea resinae]|nr:MAG: hypothetical protein M1819_002957 [Sarea resinae]